MDSKHYSNGRSCDICSDFVYSGHEISDGRSKLFVCEEHFKDYAHLMRPEISFNRLFRNKENGNFEVVLSDGRIIKCDGNDILE